ncbi:MAG: HDIG domain-containing protein [Candidatus Latescibacteria bacterium]|nr:HDIG domain-containing protein [Candidatus Latescibacterota bacterium]
MAKSSAKPRRPRLLNWRGLTPASAWQRYNATFTRLLLAGIVIGLLTYLSPYQRHHSIARPRIGEVADQRLTAPFRFNVPKNTRQLEDERQAAMQAVSVVLRHNAVEQAQIARFDSLFALLQGASQGEPDGFLQQELQASYSLARSTHSFLLTLAGSDAPAALEDFHQACRLLLIELYSAGVIDSKENLSIRAHLDQRLIPVESMHSVDALKRGGLVPILEGYNLLTDSAQVGPLLDLLTQFTVANYTVDQEQTDLLRSQARRNIAPIKRIYAQDELIVEKNVRISVEHLEALDALAAEQAKIEREDPVTRLLQTVAAGVIATLIVVIFGVYLATWETAIFRQFGALLLLAITTTTTIAIASYIQTQDATAYWVPTPLATMLVTILISPQVALINALLLALFVGHMFGDLFVALVCAFTSALAVYTVRNVRHRNQFYLSMLIVPLGYMLLIAAADQLRFVPPAETWEHLWPGLVVALLAPVLTMGLLPIFESLFNFTTDITLLELSDLNLPLLRELALRAPGTHNHSLIIAILSERAAQAIGANPLLARVGSYYHDIGKMQNSKYFTENQGLEDGHNPHDRLTPTMSNLIITAHVKDGLELAEEYGLPKAISDLIPQHHGTTATEYFYNRAIERGDESVRKDDFRYDGPKPQTKEAGILMLADSVESATRTLSERTPNRVRQLVRRITRQKFTEGELDECALTMQDLSRIEEAFMPVLIGTMHGRVEYPWQKAERREQRKLAHSN